jgi:hypothetical protein
MVRFGPWSENARVGGSIRPSLPFKADRRALAPAWRGFCAPAAHPALTPFRPRLRGLAVCRDPAVGKQGSWRNWELEERAQLFKRISKREEEGASRLSDTTA